MFDFTIKIKRPPQATVRIKVSCQGHLLFQLFDREDSNDAQRMPTFDFSREGVQFKRSQLHSSSLRTGRNVDWKFLSMFNLCSTALDYSRLVQTNAKFEYSRVKSRELFKSCIYITFAIPPRGALGMQC